MDEPFVHIVNSDIDQHQLEKDVYDLISEFNLQDQDQISLTSIDGNNDWDSSTGKMFDLDHPELYYSEINKGLHGTLIEKYIKQFSKFYRWRLLKIQGKQTYSVHIDGLVDKSNLRLHIPVVTNNDCYLCFYDDYPQDSKSTSVTHYHLNTGYAYEVNTTGCHTAVNYGHTDRYHIVGVRYENSNNGSH
jgi:hypothetical protein|tara:strand:+ start:16229 stop:16795 length:567 start_codon:yes stop_codon:yes gene_type:complete